MEININQDKRDEMIMGHYLKGNIVEKKEGAYGVVFIVEQDAIPKYVAYKTIKDEYDEEKLKAFIREAKIWFKVNGHALIPTPFYIINVKNRSLICMPFCEKSLRDYLEEKGKLSPIKALTITSQILKGLIFAKNKGIESHQDLKPENILLEDLSKKFYDWPPQDVDSSLKWKVRIADFGSANAWKELGKPCGTKPYMAPEQWELKRLLDKIRNNNTNTEDKEKLLKELETKKKEVNFSKVDVFAVGVILYELLTGKHPIGVKTSDVWPEPKKGFSRRYKADEKWKKWCKKASENIKLEDIELREEIENLIKNMLLPDFNNRLDLESAFEKVMNILNKLHKPTTKQLKLLFDYYDCWANYLNKYRRLTSLCELSKLPGQRDIIINQLLEEINDMGNSINSADDAVYFCKLCYTAGCLILKGKDYDREKIENLASKILTTATKWKSEIKTYHRYPELKFGEIALVKEPSFRDFEIYAEIIKYSIKLFEVVKGKEETEKIFSDLDNYTKSAYFYSIASDYHFRGDELMAMEILNKCTLIFKYHYLT